MTLFAILICLFLQRYLGWGKEKHLSWLDNYTQTASGFWVKLGLKNVIGLVVLLPLVLIVAGINYLLSGLWFSTLEFLFSTFILFYCLNAHNIKDELMSYFNAYDQGDQQAAFRYGSVFLDTDNSAVEEASLQSGVEELSHQSNDTVSLCRAITRRIFIQSDWYVFSILFWYILTGAVGVVIYSLITYLAVSGLKQKTNLPKSCVKVAVWLQALLDWVPVRITGFSYALAGHFAYAFTYWCKNFVSGLDKTREFAFGSGLAALELEKSDAALADVEENRMALNLVDRTIVLWIVVLALFTLVAWIS